MAGKREVCIGWVETALLIFVGVLIAILPIQAEEFGSIEGRVVDKASGEPLPDANVIIKGTLLGAAVGGDGSYSIPNVHIGSYQIIATMMGYRAVTKETEITYGERTHLDFELQESAIEMGGMVITGTRTPRYVKDVPVRTEVITARRIEERGVSNLYEALEGVPGIRIEQQCSYCNFSIVRMQGLESGHCQVLIDGQPIYSGLAGVYGLQQIPAGNIGRIEIVKGAASALYGSSAISGVINIVTKKPTVDQTLETSMSFGTYSTNEYSISASKRMGNLDAMLLAQKNTGNAIDENGDGNTDRVKTDNTSVSARINFYNLLGDDQLTFTGRTLGEERQGGELNTWENPFAAGAEHIGTTRYETGIGYKFGFGYSGEIGFNISYCLHKRSATNDAFLGDYMATHNDTVPSVNEMEPYLADEHLYVTDINYSHSVGKHRLLGGIQYSYNDLYETGRYVIVDEADTNYGEPYTSESKKYAHDIGVYTQGEFSVISNILEVVTGIRYDIHRSKDDFGGSGKVAPQNRITLEYDENAISPRLAVMYRASSSLALRGSVGTGFRVPYGFSEDLHLCSGSPRVYKPAGLKPEKSISSNFGADYSAERYTANINLFRTNLKDKIGFADASEEARELGYTYEWENIDNAYTQGIELGSRILLGPEISLDLTLTYTDAQYEHEREDWIETHGGKYAAFSKYILRVPDVTGDIGIGYTPSNWNLTLSGDYTGRMYIDYCEEEDVEAENSYIKHTDPFWVVNTRVARSFPKGGITLFAGVKNLFDYIQPEKHPDDAAFMYAPYTGRIVYSGIEIKI